MNVIQHASALSIERDGAQFHPGAFVDTRNALHAVLSDLPRDQAGIRVTGLKALGPFLEANGVLGAIAATTLGPGYRPVRALFFDKTAETNWSLGWHQDRTICVKARIEVDGYGPWTVKQGLNHVAPPFALLERMVTLRAHLDDVPIDNAPLLIAPGSHRCGRVQVEDIQAVVDRCGTFACVAAAGDVWAYSTPILHASEAAAKPVHRRVLQVDFSTDDLPGGLEWLGV